MKLLKKIVTTTAALALSAALLAPAASAACPYTVTAPRTTSQTTPWKMFSFPAVPSTNPRRTL